MTDQLIIQTAAGAVRGNVHEHGRVFWGIPYAQRPEGRARFEAPKPAIAWTGIRDASEPGATAPQPTIAGPSGPVDLRPYFGHGWVREGDYLSLSIWTPDAGRDLPVIVLVPGGGFIGSSASAIIWDGSTFARDDIVFVIVQHRLGIAGFVDVPGAPSNRGLLDVKAALQWVQANISSFGGNPRNVTLMGESAGALVGAAMLTDPDAKPLISRVIMQSGSGAPAFLPEQASLVTDAAATALGIDAGLDQFAEVSDEDLVAVSLQLIGLDLAHESTRDPMVGLNPYGLVSEVQPVERARDGAGNDIPLLIGTNTEEGRFYLAPGGETLSTTERELLDFVATVSDTPSKLLEAYRSSFPDASAGDLRALVLGDVLFVNGTDALVAARTLAGAKETYRYEFSWRSTAINGQLGAAHTVEIPFVFDRAGNPSVTGASGLLGVEAPPAALARDMHNAWVAFARTGDPGWPSVSERSERKIWDGNDNPVQSALTAPVVGRGF